jgi:ligand-binding SRPBCC domain-containing protein
MTVLRNAIHIDAPPERVWAVLARLDALHEYDPGISKSEILSKKHEGIGADRRCDMTAGGWFRERVTIWEPDRELEFTLDDCTLPVCKLRHHYRLIRENGGTRVEQTQAYTLKYGAIGAVLDALFVRRKWDAGVKSFFAGLKRYVEARDAAQPARLLGFHLVWP